MIDLNIYQLLFSYVFIVLLLFIVRYLKIRREREIIISTIRMTVQLILTGYILIYIFDNIHWLMTILIIILMEAFAIFNIIKRTKKRLSKQLILIIAFSLVLGTVSSLLYFLLIVIKISPWYDPRYFIPIAGMLIGNAMTGISLGINKLIDGMDLQKEQIECALMLGATPRKAAKEIVKKAFDSAILPTINTMLGIGIVFLPGMMTGQILAGISPTIAIEYQIAIMLGILGSVSISVIIFVELGYRTFFNKNSQLLS